jgi:F-type H+-transporting ATPase subunit gamma
MLNLIQIKQRIAAIKATQKVVEAMRLISISAYPKIHKRHLANEKFTKTCRELLEFLLAASGNLDFNFISAPNKPGCKTIIIVIASSKGLCGSFNSQLEKHANSRIEIDPQHKYEFLAMGKKSEALIQNINLLKNTNYKIKSFETPTTKNLHQVAWAVKNHIIQSVHLSDVISLSNTFKTLFSQRPKVKKLLPLENTLSSDTSDATEAQPTGEIIWEQPAKEIINQFFMNYLEASICGLLCESLLCEFAARFITTDSATQNAKNKIEQLSLQYNKIRQSLITREVAELSSSI